MKRLLLIDFSSSVCQRPTYMKNLKTSTGIDSSYVSNFLLKLVSYYGFNASTYLFALDRGHTKRDKLDSNYKGNRDNKKNPAVDVEPLLKNLPVLYCYKNGCEADDLLYTCIRILLNNSNFEEIILLSKDYDLSYTLVYYPELRHFMTSNQEVTPYSLFMRANCRPEQIPLYKAIFGDVSDNIKQLKLGRKKKEIQNMFIKGIDFQDIVGSIPESEWKLLRKNIALVKLQDVTNFKIKKGESDFEGLTDFLTTYEIKKYTAKEILNSIPSKDLQATFKLLEGY